MIYEVTKTITVIDRVEAASAEQAQEETADAPTDWRSAEIEIETEEVSER